MHLLYRIKVLRKEHKKNVWDEEDISNEFEQHYVLQDQSLLIMKRSNTSTTTFIEVNTTNVSFHKDDSLYDNINDPTVYVSAGITQALSSFDSKNQTIMKDPLPPLHKQVKLSQLKSTLKQHPDYFKDK